MSSVQAREIMNLIQDTLAEEGLGPATFTTRGSNHGCANFLDRYGVPQKVFFTRTRTDYRGNRNTVALIRRHARGQRSHGHNGHHMEATTS